MKRMPWWGWLIIALLGGALILVIAYVLHFLYHFMDGF